MSAPLFSIRKSAVILIALLCLSLSGCGFRPVYGSRPDSAGDTPIADEMNSVAIDNIPERNGQILRNDLIDLMYGKGRPAQPLYHLAVKLRVTEEDLGIQADATSTRTMVNMYGDYVLTDASGKPLTKGTGHSTSNITKISDQYATLVAREDAYARTLNEVSQQIVGRLSLYFSERSRNPQSGQPAPPAQTPSGAGAEPVKLRNAE